MYKSRTDDVNSNGNVDGSLFTGSDAREEPGVTPIDRVEDQHAVAVITHTDRQSSSRRPAGRPLAGVPADVRRNPALRQARHPLARSEFQLLVARHRLELEPL